jgi:membrane-bound lytic murein transglycosylase D
MGFWKRASTAGIILITILSLLLLTACEDTKARKAMVAPPVVVVPSPALPNLPPPPAFALNDRIEPQKFDAAKKVIDEAEGYYLQGEVDYKQGHLDRAKKMFDRALETMLRSAVPIKSDERLEKKFDDLVDRIHGYDMAALQEGDAFLKQKYEPAPSDETLAVETFPARIDEKLKTTAEKEVAEIAHDLPIAINDRVLNFLDYFTHGRGRATMENGLRRMGQYRPMIERILKETGVPRDLIYLAQVESGFQPMALSNKKAKGIWQFVPFRGAEYGLVQNWWVDERQDPEKSTRAAARHLKDLYEQYNDWYLAMAAYNCGPGNVQKAIERTGYADFWEMSDRHVLPLQTENYVPAILAVDIIAKNPEKYGFSVEPFKPIETERVTVSTPTDLRLVAETIDTSVETLHSFNPALLRMTTPPNMPDFKLNLPAGTKEKFLTDIALIPEDKRVLWRRHRITEGESLSTIARNYGTTVSAIAQVNDLTAESVLAEGAKIIIPATSTSKKITQVKHRVERGETLASIAAKYNVTPEELRKWNRLSALTKLRKGERLTVHVAAVDRLGKPSAGPAHRTRNASTRTASKKTAPANAEKAVLHSVRRGETLASIAANYNTTVEALKQLNGISDARQLRAGEKIRIAGRQ